MNTQDFQKYWALPYSILEKNSQDALLISTHAPGLSANNQVEKKMASLSKALSGILLPHKKFGTHLNSSRKSINTNLKKRNFKVSCKILAKVWEETILDNFPVLAENASKVPIDLSEKWISFHCKIFSTCHKLCDAMIKSVVMIFEQLGRVFSQVTYQLLCQ